MIITEEDYAILAAAAYNANRGIKNRINIAGTGFTELLDPNTGLPLSIPNTSTSFLSSGFSASAFINGSSIVISFEGTDFLLGANDTTANFGQTAADIAADIAWGTSIGSQQIIQAAEFYENIKTLYPNADISFTGHSLGGGLASLMSMYFNEPATVFDEAPFALSTFLEAGAIEQDFIQKGINDPSLLAFIQNYSSQSLNARESQIADYYVVGEFLSLLVPPALFWGVTNPVQVGGGDQVSPLDLHSIVLETATLLSSQFQTDTQRLPNLLVESMNTNLYAFNLADANNIDFLTWLVQDQINTGGDYSNPNGMLAKFAANMSILANTHPSSADPLDKALIDAAIEDYYYMPSVVNVNSSGNTSIANGVTSNFFDNFSAGSQVSGGVSFNLNDIGNYSA